MEPPILLDSQYRHVVFEGKKTPKPPRASAGAQPVQATIADNEPLPSRAQQEFIAWLFEQGGVDHRRYLWAPLLRRLPAVLRALRVSSLPDAKSAIERDGNLTLTALDTLLIGVTDFFRDGSLFDHLNRQVLPLLAASGSDIWCAGCSNGAELYSVLMLLGELGDRGGRRLGTDCRVRAVEQARMGAYSKEAAAAVDPKLRHRWFERKGSRYRVVPALRENVEWRVDDVFKCGDNEVWDLVLCRNAAIYLERDAASQLWRLLARALRQGGILVVGKAERPDPLLGLTRIGPSIYRR